MDPKQQTQTSQQQVSPATPPAQLVGGRGKEMPTIPSEWVSPSTPEIVLPQEIKAAGVETKPVVPSLSQSAQEVGVEHAKEATPVASVAAEPVGMKTPRSVLQHLKAAHKKVSESFSWLVRLVLKEQDKEEKGASL